MVHCDDIDFYCDETEALSASPVELFNSFLVNLNACRAIDMIVFLIRIQGYMLVNSLEL